MVNSRSLDIENLSFSESLMFREELLRAQVEVTESIESLRSERTKLSRRLRDVRDELTRKRHRLEDIDFYLGQLR